MSSLEASNEVLDAFESIPQKKIDEVVNGLKKSNESKDLYHKNALVALRKDYDEVQRRLSVLTDRLIDESITKAVYDEKLKEYKEKQHDIDLQLQDHTSADENYYITASTILSLAKRAKELFESSEVEEKRAILNYLLQNCTVNGKKLEFTIASPYNLVLELAEHPNWLPVWDAVGVALTLS